VHKVTGLTAQLFTSATLKAQHRQLLYAIHTCWRNSMRLHCSSWQQPHGCCCHCSTTACSAGHLSVAMPCLVKHTTQIQNSLLQLYLSQAAWLLVLCTVARRTRAL
jgi:hypothetical protein